VWSHEYFRAKQLNHQDSEQEDIGLEGGRPEEKASDAEQLEQELSLFMLMSEAIEHGQMPKKKILQKALQKDNSISREQKKILVETWMNGDRSGKKLLGFLRIAALIEPRNYLSWKSRVADATWAIVRESGVLKGSTIEQRGWEESSANEALLFLGETLAKTRSKKTAESEQPENAPDRQLMRDLLECLLYGFLIDNFGDAGKLLLRLTENTTLPAVGPQTVKALSAALAGNAAGVVALVRDRLNLEILGRDNTINSVSRKLAAVEKEKNEIEAQRVQLQSDYEAALVKTEALEKELAHERESARVDGVHMKDDFHQLRSKSVKLLESKLKPNLEEVLKAISRDPPRIRVIEDYVRRAVGAIEKELKRLRDN